MSRAAAVCATQAKSNSNLYVVTLPDGRMVISSQPLLHTGETGPVITSLHKDGRVSMLTTKPAKELDLAAILLLAKFIALKVIGADFPWINIFQFLFGPKFQTHVSNNPAQQLARFSACIARPSLLLATDNVVHATLCGDEDLARRMIEANPNYILQHGDATDFSGRIYNSLTPFQAALVTGDNKMAEMIKPYFDRLPNGQAEMQKQVTEIFPQGIESHFVAQRLVSETEFNPMLKEVFAAIQNAAPEDLQSALNNECNNSRLYLVLNKFRAAFTDLSQREKIFNPNHLLKAFEVYASKFDWDTPDWHKLDLFWCQVIGFVQRFLPATYAQAFANDLYNIAENNHACPRSFNFELTSGFSFYPVGGSFGGLGFNWAAAPRMVWFSRAGIGLGWQAFGRAHVPGRNSFSKLISNKNSKLSELITRQGQVSCCLIA